MKIQFYTGLTLLVLLFSYGCGGSSEIDRKQARAAMELAQNIHADVLAPKDFQQAQKAWDHAQAADKEGKTDAAKVLFSSAKIYFGDATNIAKAKKDALSRELSTMQASISNNFDQVKLDLSNNRLSDRQRSQVTAIISEVEKGNASIGKLQDQEDLINAVAAAKDVQTQIYHAQLILAGQKIK
jgi:hypothetical protein